MNFKGKLPTCYEAFFEHEHTLIPSLFGLSMSFGNTGSSQRDSRKPFLANFWILLAKDAAVLLTMSHQRALDNVSLP